MEQGTATAPPPDMSQVPIDPQSASAQDSHAFFSQYNSFPAKGGDMHARHQSSRSGTSGAPHQGQPEQMFHMAQMSDALPPHQQNYQVVYPQQMFYPPYYPQYPSSQYQPGQQQMPRPGHQAGRYENGNWMHPPQMQNMQHMGFYMDPYANSYMPNGQYPAHPPAPNHHQGPPAQYPTHDASNVPNGHQAQAPGSHNFIPPGQKASMNAISSAFPGFRAPLRNLAHHSLAQDPGFSSTAAATYATSTSGAGAILVPRGPPRKPRQSGHALWVGNLPPNATVVDLKDHFSRGATYDILSLKLMSKSNCAFVNYKNRMACAAAMQRFHDSRFHGTRLVCRLRKASMSEPLSSMTSSAATIDSGASELGRPSDGSDADSEGPLQSPTNPLAPATWEHPSADKFFVLKSLTLEDLLVSAHSGIWTTQPHNEQRLNTAFENSENVYLIFSVNKSGEYFGYARMTSKIPAPLNESGPSATRTQETEELQATPASEASQTEAQPTPSAPSNKSIPSTQSSNDNEITVAPRSIPTPKTENAPRGKIIDDLARGTIFWEADCDTDLALDGATNGEGIHHAEAALVKPVFKAGANSFQVEWLSLSKVPFFKTRGIRNSLNSNRDVKIARDGTQLAPDVGARLLDLFVGSRNIQPMIAAEVN